MKNTIKNYDAIQVGMALPDLTIDPVSRATLALYAGASGDHHPMHIDSDFAKKANLDDVIVHGMLSMAYAGRFLTNWQSQGRLKTFNTRFCAITKVHDSLNISGVVEDKYEEDNQKLVRISLQAVDQTGELKLSGDAIFDMTK